jgi:hypothetical protein
MAYDTSKGYFVSAGIQEASKANSKEAKSKEDSMKIKKLFKDRAPVPYGELKSRIMSEFSVKEDAAKKRIKNFLNEEIIKKNEEGDGYLLKE